VPDQTEHQLRIVTLQRASDIRQDHRSSYIRYATVHRARFASSSGVLIIPYTRVRRIVI
jgi:hypothetical protein